MRIAIIVLIFHLLVVSGCQMPSKNLEVVIEGGGEFPGYLAGRWKSGDPSGWEFEFEADGTITYAIIMPGFAEILPGQTKEIVGRGGKGLYKAGDWEVLYNPQDRELTVKVVTDYFYQEGNEDAIEGDSVDYLVGTISEDGKEWKADWSSSGRYIAILNVGPEQTKEEMSNVVEPEFRRTLIFKKIEK